MGSFSAEGEAEPQSVAKASLERLYIQAASSSSDKVSLVQHTGSREGCDYTRSGDSWVDARESEKLWGQSCL